MRVHGCSWRWCYDLLGHEQLAIFDNAEALATLRRRYSETLVYVALGCLAGATPQLQFILNRQRLRHGRLLLLTMGHHGFEQGNTRHGDAALVK